MSVHIVGIAGLVAIFVLGTARGVNLGALAMLFTFVVGAFVVHETPREMYTGFPVDLFVFLTGVTYLFGIAVQNGTVGWIVTTPFGSRRAAACSSRGWSSRWRRRRPWRAR